MKKSLPMMLSLFSGLIIVAFIFAIITIVLASSSLIYDEFGNATYDNSKLSLIVIFQYLCLISELICIIGTFVVSIIILVKSKILIKQKGFFKATAIVGIVISSCSLLFSFLGAFVSSGLAFIVIAGIFVVFGLSIGCNVKMKKISSTNQNGEDKKESNQSSTINQ